MYFPIKITCIFKVITTIPIVRYINQPVLFKIRWQNIKLYVLVLKILN